jgi:hypothetical protein
MAKQFVLTEKIVRPDSQTEFAPREVMREVASGSTTVAAATTVTALTFTRAAAERLTVASFTTNNVAGSAWANDRSVLIGGITDALSLFLERTANTDEANLRIANGLLAGSRTSEWYIVGLTP